MFTANFWIYYVNVEKEVNNTEIYLANNYGACKSAKCFCLTNGWLGTKCVNWKPFGAKTFEELGKIQNDLFTTAK